MTNQPQQLGALLPEALPPQRGAVSPQAYRRRYIPKTYAPADVESARRIIARWNICFGGRPRGYRANPGDACNVKAYVRMLGKMRASDGLFDFSESDVAAAIIAYSTDPANRDCGWRRFADWCTCENIDHQLRRVGRAPQQREARADRSAARACAVSAVQAQRDAAKKLLEHVGLAHVCEQAARRIRSHGMLDPAQLRAHLRDLAAVRSGSKTLGPLIDRIRAVLDGFERLACEARGQLLGRAEKAFICWYERKPLNRVDGAIIYGIALSLFDLDSNAHRKES